MSDPIRTCVGCGSRAPQGALHRFVAPQGGGLRLDVRGRAPGRGAYLHGDPSCWTAFVRRRGAVRSLHASPTPAERAHLVSELSATVEAAR